MTRIIAGTAGGRRLLTPNTAATRPTSDRVREALFSSLESAFGSFAGLRVLDLFAGSGAVGLEALSRGAAMAVLVESDRRTATLIEQNARRLGLAGAHAVRQRVEAYLDAEPAEGFDLVYLDPPYDHPAGRVRETLTRLAAGWYAADAVVVVERPRREDGFGWSTGIEPVRRKVYGETVLWYGRPHA